MEQGEAAHSTAASGGQEVPQVVTQDTTIEAGVTRLLTGTAHASGESSVAAAVEVHRAARATLNAVSDPDDNDEALDSLPPHAEAAWIKAEAAESDALQALLNATPASPAELAQLLRYLAGSAVLEDLFEPALAMPLLAKSAEAVAAAHALQLNSDAELLELGRRLDEAHAVWLRAVEAYREPSARYATIIQEAHDQGGPAMADYERAEAAPAWQQSHDAESNTFASLGDLALQVLRSIPLNVSGLAVLARAVIPHVWATGSFEADGALGNEENIDRQAVRFLVDACLSLGGVDWKGNPVGRQSTVRNAVGTDPVFALIADHRAAYAAWVPLSQRWNSLLLTDPAYAAAEEAEREPGDRERAALAALMAARPTTLAGVTALAEYLPGAIRQTSMDSEESEGERALRTIAAALAALAPATAPSPAEPDPIFGAISAYRAAWEAMEAAGEPEAADRAGIAISAAYRRLRTTRPTTPVGYAALADHLAWHIEREPEFDNTVGEHVAAMLIAGRSALRLAPQPAGPSPELLAMIGEWKALARRMAREDDDEKATALSRQHSALQLAIYRWPAASIADLHAKVPVFRDEMKNAIAGLVEGADPAESMEGASWLGLFRDLAALSQAAPAGRPEPDPVLVAIKASRQAEAAMAAFGEADEEMTPERRTAEDALCTAQLATRETAWKTVPTTQAGRVALVEYARFQIQAFTNPSGHIDSPESLIADILDAISAAIEAERPEPIAPCASASMVAAETPTLSAMSIGELADLYDASLRASEQLAALACLPGCTGEDRARVGIVLDLEADWFGDIAMDCAEELKSRLPSTDEERADRVSILAKHAARFHAWADLAALASAESSDSAGRHRRSLSRYRSASVI